MYPPTHPTTNQPNHPTPNRPPDQPTNVTPNRIYPELHPGARDDSWTLLLALGNQLLTRALPVSVALLGLRGALMTVEAPLLALVGLGGGEAGGDGEEVGCFCLR